MIKFLLLFFGFFFFLSCEKKIDTISNNTFIYFLTKTLIAAEKVQINPMSKAKGLPLLVAEGKSFDLVKPIHKKYCLFYQRPFKDSQGKAWLSFVDLTNDCEVNDSAIFWGGISELSLELQGINKKYHVVIKINHESKKLTQKIPLLNYKDKLPFKFAEQEKIGGYAPLLKVVSKQIISLKVGKKDDSFSRKTAKRCLQVNENCEVVGEDLCDRCRYGQYEVVDYNCPIGGSRFCGENKCGEKDEPACPSGKKVFGISNKQLCFDDSEAGFCQGDLRPVCNEDNILICR